MDPVARAELYLALAKDPNQGPWYYNYVKGQGYTDFLAIDKPWNIDV